MLDMDQLQIFQVWFMKTIDDGVHFHLKTIFQKHISSDW